MARRNDALIAGVAALGLALALGCQGVRYEPVPDGRYDADLVEQALPGCVAGGSDVRVCACTLDQLHTAGNPLWLKAASWEAPHWPPEGVEPLAQMHARCESWARQLALVD